MRKVPAGLLVSLFLTPLFAATTAQTPAQSACTALNAAKGEGKFTGQISTPPDGSSMEVSYGDQTVLVHYNNSVTVCQGGQPASLNALTRNASVAVFGPLRRNGKNMEMAAARIFVVGPPQAARTSPEPAQSNPREAQPRTTGQRSFPNSVILGGGTYAATMQRLHMVRKYALSDLRAKPQGTLGEAHLDFRPMLNNPKALFNLALAACGSPGGQLGNQRSGRGNGDSPCPELPHYSGKVQRSQCEGATFPRRGRVLHARADERPLGGLRQARQSTLPSRFGQTASGHRGLPAQCRAGRG